MRTTALNVLRRGMVVMLLLSASCVIHTQTDSSTEAPEIVSECLSPYNDPKVMKEWKKIEDRLHARGILVMIAGSIGAAVGTKPHQAEEARGIISQMIRDGEVDVKLLQLSIIEHQGH